MYGVLHPIKGTFSPDAVRAVAGSDLTVGAHGACVGGVCYCAGGYSGDDCSADNCQATSTAADDGSDGNFYCLNGDIGGNTGSCTCTNCDSSYGGANCASYLGFGSVTADDDNSGSGDDDGWFSVGDDWVTVHDDSGYGTGGDSSGPTSEQVNDYNVQVRGKPAGISVI